MARHFENWIQGHCIRLLFLLPAVCALAGVYFLLSGRGVFGHLYGAEIEIARCRIPETSAMIRVYEGNLGATTAYWYKVTYQKTFFSRERIFFYAYAAPMVGSVSCARDHVDLDATGGVISIPIVQLEGQLLDHPMYFRYDRQEDIVGSSRGSGYVPRMCGAICGVQLLVLALMITSLVLRAQRRAG